MNVAYLRGKIYSKGYNVESFCKACGFVRATFDRRMNGKSEFDRAEIGIMIEVLDLTMEDVREIFFAEKVA